MRYAVLVSVSFLVVFGGMRAASADVDPGAAAFAAGDFNRAVALWRPAAKKGVPGAQLGLGRLLLARADLRGLEWIKKAARSGYLPAEYFFGVMHFTATYVPRDPAVGVSWLEKAAAHTEAEEAGHRLAAARTRHALYMAYAEGFGTRKNLSKAITRLRAAADAGYADAQMGLAGRLEKGKGVVRDLVEAHKYYVLAWKQSVGPAKARALAVRRRLEAKAFEHSRSLVREWMNAKEAGTLGWVYRFKDRTSRGERIQEKAEILERQVLEMATIVVFIDGLSCELIWLRERKVVRALRRGGSSWAEHWVLDRCGERKVVRVDFRRSGTKDVRYTVKLVPGAS